MEERKKDVILHYTLCVIDCYFQKLNSKKFASQIKKSSANSHRRRINTKAFNECLDDIFKNHSITHQISLTTGIAPIINFLDKHKNDDGINNIAWDKVGEHAIENGYFVSKYFKDYIEGNNAEMKDISIVEKIYLPYININESLESYVLSPNNASVQNNTSVPNEETIKTDPFHLNTYYLNQCMTINCCLKVISQKNNRHYHECAQNENLQCDLNRIDIRLNENCKNAICINSRRKGYECPVSL